MCAVLFNSIRPLVWFFLWAVTEYIGQVKVNGFFHLAVFLGCFVFYTNPHAFQKSITNWGYISKYKIFMYIIKVEKSVDSKLLGLKFAKESVEKKT